MYPLGAMGASLGASIIVAIPLAIWIGLLKLFERFFARFVDGPRRTLRIAIDRHPRQSGRQKRHFLHELREKLVSFVRAKTQNSERFFWPAVGVFFAAQILAEVFGGRPTVKTSSWSAFGESMVVLGVINLLSLLIGAFMIGAFGSLAAFSYNFLTQGPALFGYRAAPPAVDNEALIQSFIQNREEIVGRAVSLETREVSALAAQLDTQNLPTHLRAPLSGKTCLAFRVVGENDGHPVRDADAVSFAVVTDDDKRCVVTNTDVVVDLTAIDDSVREALLEEGNRIRIVGRRVQLQIGSEGYRGNGERRMMLDAGDGLPVVITDETHRG